MPARNAEYALAESDDPRQPFAIVNTTYQTEVTRYERLDIAHAVLAMMNTPKYRQSTTTQRLDLRLEIVRTMRKG